MRKILLILASYILYLFVFASDAMAVTISIDSFPSTISSLDQFQVSVSVSGATDATNYLRIDLYKDGTSNYFGETYNGNSWYNASDGKNYLPVQIQNATASAVILGRLGGPNTNEYSGFGTYKLKIRRYTASGNPASDDNQSPVDIQINYTFPTPTPTPPQSTPMPSPTPVKTIAPTPLKTATPKPSPTPVAEQTPEVLGQETTQPSETVYEDPTPIPTNIPEVNRKTAMVVIGVVFLCLGIIAIGIAAYMTFVKTKTLTP